MQAVVNGLSSFKRKGSYDTKHPLQKNSAGDDDGEKADRWPLSIIRIPPLAEFSLGLQLAC